jgi:hypothetical protein
MHSTKAQIAEPAVWSIELDRLKVRVPEGFVARVSVEIAKGYHLYSVTQPAGGPLPTRISAMPGLSVRSVEPWPQPTRMFDPKFGMETEWHAGSVLFDVYAEAEATLPEGNQEVVFKVEYQLCDEQTCRRPESKELRAALFVEAATLAATCAAQGAADASGQAATSTQSSEQRLRRLGDECKTGDELEAGVRQMLHDDPAFATGYIVLAQRYAARGDLRRQRALLREGLSASPGSEELHYQLAACSGTPRRHRLLSKFARRFRKSPRAVAALLGLARLATRRAEARKLLERAQKLTAGRPGAIWTERELFPLLAESDPARVVRLLTSASRRAAKSDGFLLRGMTGGLLKFYTSVWEIQRLLKKGKTEKAARVAQLLQEPDIPHWGASETEKALTTLIQAKALAADGQVEQAYESLTRHPLILLEQELLDAAIRIGARLHKSPKRVEYEVWQKTLQQTYPRAEFEVRTKRGGKIRSQDYCGRVLLVNVWNPG